MSCFVLSSYWWLEEKYAIVALKNTYDESLSPIISANEKSSLLSLYITLI